MIIPAICIDFTPDLVTNGDILVKLVVVTWKNSGIMNIMKDSVRMCQGLLTGYFISITEIPQGFPKRRKKRSRES
jgi:hypothetical protein